MPPDMTALIVILSIVLALWLALWLSPVHRVMFRQRLDAATPLPDPVVWPAVTVIVPARNEESMLPRTIPSICTQDYPNLRVIVVDDQSDDRTPAALEQLRQSHPNLTVIRAADRPVGWCGKPWAVWQAVQQTDTELLLFTDADIHYHPAAVRQAVRLLQSGPHDVVSLFPQLEFSSTIEKIGLAGLVTILALIYPTGVTNNPKSKQAMAAGGFILVRRDKYLAAGGHEAVKSHIVEDINLARAIKGAGGVTHCRLTDDLISTQMYESFSDLWEGLSKNAYAGMEYQPRKFIVGVIMGALLFVLQPVYLLVSVAFALRYPSAKMWAIAALCAGINLLMAAVHWRTIRHFRLPWYHALFMPLSLGLYQIISINSAYHHHFKGGNVWKGRRYAPEVVTSQPAKPAS